MRAQRQTERPASSSWTGSGLGQWSPPPPSRSASSATGDGAALTDRGPFLVAVAVAAAVLTGLLLALGTDLLSAETKRAVSDVALIPLAGFVAVAAARAARRAPTVRLQRAWGLLAAAGACWMFGELAWSENRYGYQRVGDPSWADVFYLAVVLPAAGSLLAFSRRGPRSEHVRNLLDALVVAGSVVFVSKALALSVIVPAAPADRPLARAVYLAYPLTDIVLATLAFIVLTQVEAARRTSMTLLAVGILAFVVTDTWYSYRGALGTYAPGSVWDIGWVVGYLLMGLAALAPGTTGAQPDGQRTERQQPVEPSALAVYVPVAVAVTVAAVRPQPPDDRVLVVSGVLVLALFGIRQVLLARENVRLGRSLQGRLLELEQRTTDLRLLGEQTERIVGAVVDGVLEVGSDGRISFANPAAARLLDRLPASLPDMHERELFASADAAARAGSSVIAEALRTGREATSVRAIFRRPDGTTFPVKLTLGPVLDHGAVLCTVVVFRDVTGQRNGNETNEVS